MIGFSWRELINVGLSVALFSCSLALCGNAGAAPAEAKPVTVPAKQERWALFLEGDILSFSVEPYNTLVFSFERHPALRPLLDRGKTILATLNLLEISPDDFGFEEAKKKGLLLGPSPWHSGKQLVDIRNIAWQSYIIEKKLPNMLIRGFQGVFINSLAQAADMGQLNGKAYPGMVDATSQLIKAIRMQYPGLFIMVDAHDSYKEMTNRYVQAVVGMSVLTAWDPGSKTYHIRPAAELSPIVARLQQMKRDNPLLKIYTLEQWNAGGQATLDTIYAKLQGYGFIPYVNINSGSVK